MKEVSAPNRKWKHMKLIKFSFIVLSLFGDNTGLNNQFCDDFVDFKTMSEQVMSINKSIEYWLQFQDNVMATSMRLLSTYPRTSKLQSPNYPRTRVSVPGLVACFYDTYVLHGHLHHQCCSFYVTKPSVLKNFK